MTRLKTILMTAALVAVPSVGLAQVSTDAVADQVKEKAVDTVMDNMTTDDAVIAGKTMIKGGSKEDAAVAVVKGRVNNQVEGITGGASMNDLSVDGAMDAGKTMAMDKAKGSSTTYTNGVKSGHSVEGAMDAGKTMATDKTKGSSTTYTDGVKSDHSVEGTMDAGKTMAKEKAMGSSTSYAEPVIQKSQDMMTSTPSSTTAPTTTMAPVSCPAGTTDAGNGTCMITGDFKY